MYSHDPFQTYSMLGPYSALQPPYTPWQLAFGQPGGGLYSQPNPFAAGHQIHPFAGLNNPFALQSPQQQGLPIQGGYPGAQLFNPLGIPQNPYAQPALAILAAQNPWLAASLHNPALQPALGFGGMQPTIPFNYPLAPQTALGSGIGQPIGQWNPFAQAALRQQTGYGISPLAGGF